ncbi:hypothetical protein F5I97DRAFT_1925147 [Phlebopus sp. FC_14]|nr:hypothetical protein F5I97DRAFT_1925147 [Phlebopus sp. FC_14]
MSLPSLLTALHDVLGTTPASDDSAHPFTNSYSKTCARLNAVINTTAQLSHGLTQLSAVPLSTQGSKLVSLMKQHTAISASIATSRAATNSLSSTEWRAVFPDAAPPSPTRLAEWGRNAGMEAFIDTSSTSATTTVVLAGKVLVLDIDVDGVVVVKTSFAVGNNVSNGAPAAPELDAFLAREVARWVNAARRASAAEGSSHTEDPSIQAARYGRAIQDHLRYLMMLDSLAAAEGEHGIRWFMEPVFLTRHLTSAEDQILARFKALPLDKMLAQRVLPIAYLNTPSTSFLVWLSPLAYLQLARSSSSHQLKTVSASIDIPLAHLMTSLSNQLDGATIPSLRLVPSTDIFNIGPPPEGQNDHIFPAVLSHTWVLDFTRPSCSDATRKGVIVSQTRMRAIQSIIGGDMDANILMNLGTPPAESVTPGNTGPFGSISSLSSTTIGQLGFNGFAMGSSQGQSVDTSGGGGSSWVDLLLNQGSSAEHYKVTYHSPSSAHPPLNLRLTSPQEPGFVLQLVPVKTTRQLSCILEIVREQCWLNELLGMLQWQPDSVASFHGHTISTDQPSAVHSDQEGKEVASADLLASVLAGTVFPRSIPVSVHLPSTSLPSLSQTSQTSSNFGMGGFGIGPPPASGVSSSGSLFGSTDIDMDMEIPGLSMSMNSTIDMGMDMELTAGSAVPSRPPPTIVLTSPARAPATGLIELRVSFGEVNGGSGANGSESGVRVESFRDVDTRGMDEVVRRGGIWGLPGRVWAAKGRKQA